MSAPALIVAPGVAAGVGRRSRPAARVWRRRPRLLFDGLGFNLHWPKLEVDLYVPALVSSIFGTRAWVASEFARRAGWTKSPTKSAAARAAGAKGGRPRKTAVTG